MRSATRPGAGATPGCCWSRSRSSRARRLPRAARARDAGGAARRRTRASSWRRRSGSRSPGCFAAVSGAAPAPAHRPSGPALRLGCSSAGSSLLMAAWAVVSLAETLAPRRGALAAEQLDGWQIALAVAGVVALRARGARLLPPLPPSQRAVRARDRRRVRAARRGDGRDRLGAKLARLVVGVAPADAGRVRR